VLGAVVAEFEREGRKEEERVGRGVVKELNVLGGGLDGVEKGGGIAYRVEEVVNRCAVRDVEVIGSFEKALKPLEQRRHSILVVFALQVYLKLKVEVDIEKLSFDPR